MCKSLVWFDQDLQLWFRIPLSTKTEDGRSTHLAILSRSTLAVSGYLLAVTLLATMSVPFPANSPPLPAGHWSALTAPPTNPPTEQLPRVARHCSQWCIRLSIVRGPRAPLPLARGQILWFPGSRRPVGVVSVCRGEDWGQVWVFYK